MAIFLKLNELAWAEDNAGIVKLMREYDVGSHPSELKSIEIMTKNNPHIGVREEYDLLLEKFKKSMGKFYKEPK